MSANLVDPSIWKLSGFFSMPLSIISTVPSGCGCTSSLESGEPATIVAAVDMYTRAVIWLSSLEILKTVVNRHKEDILRKRSITSLMRSGRKIR